MASSIKSIRERIGGSQQWWADYLNITLGQLKMAEGNKRSLPTAALLKLSVIELLPPPPNAAKAGSKKAASGKSNTLAAHIRKFELQLHRLENLLETTQQRYSQAIAANRVTTQLLKAIGTTEEERKDKLLLEAMGLEAAKNEEKYGTTAQALLQWKITCLAYAIAEAKKLVANN